MFAQTVSTVAGVVTRMSTTTARSDRGAETTVEVRATGHVRTALGTGKLSFTFEGDTLREFLEAFFAAHDDVDLASMLLAQNDADAAARGWAPAPTDPPGTWRKNPEGENTRTYARVTVNGRFNETLDGFDTELSDGDRVGLIYPFMFCC